MTTGKLNSQVVTATQALFDKKQATEILCEAGIVWPASQLPADVRIERGWPERNGDFAAEWSFQLDGRRCAVNASTCTFEGSEPGRAETRPTVTPKGLCSLDVCLPDIGIRLHTPDCDPAMRHLSDCLDAEAVEPALAPYWTTPGTGPDSAIDVDLLAYRAGKRAAIAYRRTNGERLLAKTFRGDRGERLIVRHVDLATRLRCRASNGLALRVAEPLGFLPQWNMALFEWCNGGVAVSGASDEAETANRAVDALTLLHALEASSTASFTRADEKAVLQRWHDTLRAVTPSLVQHAAPLVAALVVLAEADRDIDTCTVHRDFYEKQFLHHEGTITLLDLDTLAAGSPCIDLGNLLAHLRLTHAISGGGLDAYLELAEAVVDRYTKRRGAIDRSALAFYWASAAFRVGAVHALRTATRAHTPALWGLAEVLLRSQGALALSDTEIACAQPDLTPIFRRTNP